jgi:ubiquinone/menaquinone biosynthesis C-methylase UbiE
MIIENNKIEGSSKAFKTVFKGQVQSPAIAALPSDSMAGKWVLDVGCGTGKDLTHEVYANSQRYGIDPDAESIAYGRKHYPGISLALGVAESLPYEDQHFDFAISRVALLYADIPVALAEVARVLRPAAEFVVTLHDYRTQLKYTFTTIRRVLDFLIYVLPVSLLACAFRHTPKRFWNGTRETFQLGWCFSRQLRKAGFRDIRTERVRSQWVFRARRI